MHESIPLEQFLKLPGAIFDVRSEGEFAQGHIPNAINLPLFNDVERALVGTSYKQEGFLPAFLLGLKVSGPKLESFVQKALACQQNGQCKILCWRGGMRSQSVSWLLQMAQLKSITLRGGYKAFRRWVLSMFQKPYLFKVLGGLTGSGKTETLKTLKNRGEQVIDLELLASHRGSAFGLLGMPPQPTTEHFENCLALELLSLDSTREIWIEDESRTIGICKIPDAFFQSMRLSPLYLLERTKEERLANLIKIYGATEKSELAASVHRIAKKLGGSRTQEVISWIQKGDLTAAAGILLEYYDSSYMHSLKKRQQIIKFLV